MLALGTAVLVGMCVSCTPGHHSAGPTPTAAARAALARKTSLATVVVPVRGGFDAAAYDLDGHLQFWQYASGTWREAAQSTYPEDAGDGTGTFDESGVSVSGADLPGAPHAVFIVTGPFTGDGSGHVVVYGDGPQGWGVLDQQGRASLPSSGTGVSDNIMIYLGARFTGGTLETDLASGAFDEAFGSGFPVRSYWHWSGSGLVLDHDNIMTARPVPAATVTVLPLPSAAPPDGVYGVLVEGASEAGSGTVLLPGGPADAGITLTLRPARLQGCTSATACAIRPGTGQYTERPAADTLTDYPVVLADADKGREEISGPLWPLLGVAETVWPDEDSLLGTVDLDAPSAFASLGQSPWYIPQPLGVAALGRIPQPEPAEITFQHGRPVEIRLL